MTIDWVRYGLDDADVGNNVVFVRSVSVRLFLVHEVIERRS